jgi:hypothetical protein
MVVGFEEIEDMPQSDASFPPLPEDRAAILFSVLDVAQARGEYAKAAEAQRELRELGWVVTRKRYRQTTQPSHPSEKTALTPS